MPGGVAGESGKPLPLCRLKGVWQRFRTKRAIWFRTRPKASQINAMRPPTSGSISSARIEQLKGPGQESCTNQLAALFIMKDLRNGLRGAQHVGVVASFDMAHFVPNRCHTPTRAIPMPRCWSTASASMGSRSLAPSRRTRAGRPGRRLASIRAHSPSIGRAKWSLVPRASKASPGCRAALQSMEWTLRLALHDATVALAPLVPNAQDPSGSHESSDFRYANTTKRFRL
jgi:hypothetical protein